MKNVWRIFLLLMILNDLSLISSEPQYQQQQPQPQVGNYNNNNNNNNVNNNNIQNNNNNNIPSGSGQPYQQYRQPPPPPTTAAPSFFQRLSNWFYFFGDDSSDRRPPPPRRAPPPPPPPPQNPPLQQPQQNFPNQPVQNGFQNQPVQNGFQNQPVQNGFPNQPVQNQQPNFQNQPQQNFPNQLQQNNFQNQQPVAQNQQFNQVPNGQFQNGSRPPQLNTNYGTPGFNSPQPNGGFQPIIANNYQGSGSSFHPVTNTFQVGNNQNNHINNVQPQPQNHLVPSTLQQQIVGSQQDPRILKPSQPVQQNSNQFRDPEPTTPPPNGGPNVYRDPEFDFHPCNNVPWVPIAPPPDQFPPVTQVPPNVIPRNTVQPPIKLEVRPKGHVHSVSPYPPGAASNPEPSIITAAPPVQNQQLIQLQLQQQQQQLQNLQLQQLQFQQQQLQQQLAQLKVASSSSQVYTTVAYSNEDSKPAASELRNVTLNQSNQLLGNAGSDEDYASEEEPEEDEDDDRGISGVTVTFPVEVTSVVPKTRYYSSRTTTSTTTEKPPTTFQSSLPPPTDPYDDNDGTELGNGVQIIYSASLQTNAPPIRPYGRRNPDDPHLIHPEVNPPISHFNNLLSEEEDSVARETVPIAVSTRAPPTRPVSYLTTFKVGTHYPTTFQRYATEEPVAEHTTPIPITVTTAAPTTVLRSSSMTAAIGGYKNFAPSTKKPKQIQIIIPYSTYKKPEPFRPKDAEEIDHSPEESNQVISTSVSTTTLPPPKSRFVTRESMKYFHSTSNIKDILRKETTRPFSRPPTAIPEKPTKMKKVEPVKVSKDSKPFTLRIPKMTPMPPVFNLSGLTADHRLEVQTTTQPPRTFRPTIVMVHPSRFAPHYINITRVRPYPTTSHTHGPKTTIAQLLRTTKIFTKSPNAYDEPEYISRPLPPIIYRRTTFPTTTTTTTTTTERPETTPVPIYERNEWDIDPLLLQRRIDTWTEQQFASDDYIRKSSTIPLHRVTKAIPLEFLTTTMLPALRSRGRDSWRNVKIAISPHTKEKVYVVTPQPWQASQAVHKREFRPAIAVSTATVAAGRFSIRPTPLYQLRGGTRQPTVDVSPESVNDLVEHKSRHRVASGNHAGGSGFTTVPLSAVTKLKQRKYVRKKTFNSIPLHRSSSSSSSDESV
ncbi:ataxin-2 homolog isoform X2 [Culex pipiens pallens]|uniref:ataxin-2 homolog isoform X2 n=1 Tax=Culex pipiens pallens TaxID=42434 RepID=UPI0022AB2BDE|nr:ataxin-2 homolog isoform X2 [Culex pipiens pallens]